LLAYPEILSWSAVRYKPFRDGRFMLYNTNRLLGRFRGLDGIKTGYTKRAGSCLVATAKRGDMRLISVVLGCRSEKIRDAETRRLLSWGFNNFSRVPIVHEGESMGIVALDWGMEPEVRARTRSAAVAVLSSAQQKQIRRKIHLPGLRPAPVEAGEKLGRLTVSLGDSLIAEVDVIAAKSVARMGLWDKFLSYF
jgi:D-alanyl-D-alanine carboxypeptidase (penicillin-binding protein 5/6)